VIAASFVVLALAATGFFVRLLRGPSLADRVLALDGLVATGISVVAVQAMASGRGAFLPVLVVLTGVAFVGTAAAARFIEGRE
jgi:multicomponent Na+:H+ antiporter subunit F